MDNGAWLQPMFVEVRILSGTPRNKKMKAGLYWGKCYDNPDNWILVEIVPDMTGNDLVFYMGSDQDSPTADFIILVKVELYDPDGNPYHNTGEGN